jgi:hypothetical protein
LTHSYDEIQVFGGIAERTGNQFTRAGVRGRRGVCRSVAALGATSRRLGDGYYYLSSSAWPADQTTVDLNRNWSTLGS